MKTCARALRSNPPVVRPGTTPFYKTALVALGAAVLFAAPAHATRLFTQDFDGALGANERIGGNFGVTQGAMGHAGTGGAYLPNERSFYEVTFDFSNVETAFLSFDWNAMTEKNWDGWNVQAKNKDIVPFSLPIEAEDPIYNAKDGYARIFTGTGSGRSVFDLSSYAGEKTVIVRINFFSDVAVQGPGVRFDNMALDGRRVGESPGAVPEPASWALMILGFGGIGAAMRRHRTVAPRVAG